MQKITSQKDSGTNDSADDIIGGWITNHNFVKRCRKINKTNAERCGMKDVPDKMPWMFMIRRSAYIQTLLSANL